MENIRRGISVLLILVAAMLLSFQVDRGYAQTQEKEHVVIVTTNADSGEGSLRFALLNAQPGDVIRFDPTVFPPHAPMTIELRSLLPVIYAGSITIDGTGAGVILDGKQVVLREDVGDDFHSGLVLNSDLNVIRGLQIVNFAGNAIFINGGWKNQVGGPFSECSNPCNVLSGNGINGIYIDGGGQNIIQGNYLGTDSTGSTANGNLLNGIRVFNSRENLIGGEEAGAGNLASANSIGIEINLEGSIGNRVVGNIIGLDISTTKPVGNLHGGISMAFSVSENVIENNIIAGNETGIVLEKGAHDNILRGNFLGTNPSLAENIGNRSYGLVLASAYNNTIGPANVISWNQREGIALVDTYIQLPLGNRIFENTISNNDNMNIMLADGITTWLAAPHDLVYANGEVSGYAQPYQKIEIYTDSKSDGGIYVGTTQTNNRGVFTFTIPARTEMGLMASALAFDADGTTSLFSEPVEFKHPVIVKLPGVVSPKQVSTDPKVVGINFISAVILLAYCYLMTTLFNKTLETYDEIIKKKINLRLDAFRKRFKFLSGWKITKKVMLNWLIFLVIIAFIQTWLNPGTITIGERLLLTLSIFLSAFIVGGLQELGEHLFRKKTGNPLQLDLSQIRWVGILVAGFTTFFSRLIHFSPGILLGTVDAFLHQPEIEDKRQAGLRIFSIKGFIFAATLLGWVLSIFTESFSPALTALLQMVFTVALEALFFELLPLAKVLDGNVLIRWNFWSWIGLYLPITFFTFWLLFNPGSLGIQAIQQNTMSALIIAMSFLAAMLVIANIVLFFYKKQSEKVVKSSS